jgi:hypothetical protein
MRPLSCPCENGFIEKHQSSDSLVAEPALHSRQRAHAVSVTGARAWCPPTGMAGRICPIAPPVTQKTSILVSKSTSLAYPL